MGLLQRIKDLVVANINELVSRAENPEVMLNHYIEEGRENLKELNIALNRAVADKLQLEKKIQQTEQAIQSWARQAQVAVGQGKDDLAREALQRKYDAEKTLAGLRNQLAEQGVTVEQMRENYELLEKRLEEARSKRDELIMRQHRADAQKKANEALGRLSQSSAIDNIDRMEDKVERMEAEARAAATLASTTVEERFRSLDDEAKQSAVEAELERLKQTKG